MGLIKAYMALDDFLVARANDTVKAWNWTTGGTRAGLAKIVSTAGTAVCGMSPFYDAKNNPLADFGFPLVYSIATLGIHVAYNGFDKYDECLDDVKDFSLEKIRNDLGRVALPLSVSGGFLAIIGGIETEIPDPTNIRLLGLGSFFIGTSIYLMRADYQTPRKDCVRRGLGKLSEIVQDWRATPEPVPVDTNYQGVEN